MHTCAWREPLGPIVSENMLRHASRSHAATMLSTRLRRGTALRQVVRRPNKVDCTWQQARNIVVHEAPAQAHRHGARHKPKHIGLLGKAVGKVPFGRWSIVARTRQHGPAEKAMDCKRSHALRCNPGF